MDIIGVLHLLPLPGSPRGTSLDNVLARALHDANILVQGGIRKAIVENFGDAPFYKDQVPPHVIAMMTYLIQNIQQECSLELGVNVLRNDAMSALAIAATTGCSFIRVNVLSGAAWTDQGYIEGKAIDVLLYRERLKKDISIMADIKVKHAIPAGTSDIVQLAKELIYRAGADQIIITGEETGKPCDIEDVQNVYRSFDEHEKPHIYLGSGVTPDNIMQYQQWCSGCIVGTYFHKNAKISEPLDLQRVQYFMERMQPKHF